MNDEMKASCHVCHFKESQDTLIYHNDDWTVTTVQDMPGIIMLSTSSHDEGLAFISPSAAAAFGPLVRALSAGIVEQEGFDFTALMHLGDNSRHTHMMLIGRRHGGKAIADTSPLRDQLPELRDADACRALAARLRPIAETSLS